MSRYALFFALLLCCHSALMAQDAAPDLDPGGADALEPNNAIGQATPLAFGKVRQASIQPAKDVDFFVVEVPQPGHGHLDILIRNVPKPIAPFLQMLDAQQKELQKIQRPFGTPIFHRLLVKAPGKYYFALRDGRGDWQDKMDDDASPQAMAITVAFTPVSMDFEPNNKLEEAKEIELDKTYELALFPDGDRDYFKLDVPEPAHGIVSLTVSNTQGDLNPSIRVMDKEQSTLASQYAREPGRDNRLLFHVTTPGVRYIHVQSSERSSMPYTLRVAYEPTKDPAEPNDSLESAKPLALGEPKQAWAFPMRDADFYQLEIPKPGIGELRVLLRGGDDNFAPYLTLFGPDGKQIDSESRNPGLEMHYIRELTAPGTHSLRVQDHRSSALSKAPYTVLATYTPAVDPYEPNGNHDTARTIETGKPFQACLFPQSDNDYYKLTIPKNARGTLRIRVDGLSDKFRPYLRLYDASKKDLQYFERQRDLPLVMTRSLDAGGDFFTRLYANGPSSVEPYTMLVSFEPAPATEHEPNDSFETAEALKLGQPRQGTLFPGDDSDYYKLELRAQEVGELRIEAGEFHDHIHPHLALYNSEQKEVRALRRHVRRAVLPVTVEQAGTYYVRVYVRDGHKRQFDVEPYTLTVTRRPGIDASKVDEGEPNGGLLSAHGLQLGKASYGQIATQGDEDFYKVEIDKPSYLDVSVENVSPKVDPILSMYRFGPEDVKRLKPKSVLYLHGPRGDFVLDGLFPDLNFTRIEHNAEEAKTVFANAATMKRYDAIVVACLHDPARYDLPSPRVQQNIKQYVRGGGRFIVLTPFCALKLFGIEVVEPGRWHEDVAVDVQAKHPLLSGFPKGRVRYWDACESLGYFTGWQAAGFQLLHAHASDPEKHALTIAKQLEQGYLIFDAQTIGHHRNWPEAGWKFRAYLGVPQPECLGYFDDTHKPDRAPGNGSNEGFRVMAPKPGTYYIGIRDNNHREFSEQPYSMRVTATPLSPPKQGGSSIFDATAVELEADSAEAEASLAYSADRPPRWFVVPGREAAELTVRLTDVPCNIDPEIAVYGNVMPDPLKRELPKPKRVLYLHGERGDFHLDQHFVDFQFDRIEWNDERAHGILLKLDNLSRYDAIVVDAITRPNEFGLGRETVMKTIDAYVKQGGRFMLFSPLCELKLWGIANAQWGDWYHDNVRETYSPHPLLSGRRPDEKVNGWRSAETIGYWVRQPNDGFTPLFTDYRNPQRLAVTLVKQIGKGYLILDTQTIGQRDNVRQSQWKLFRYLGQKPFVRHVRDFNKTYDRELGGDEEFTIVTEPRLYYVAVRCRNEARSQKPLSLRFSLKSYERALEPDNAPEVAKKVENGQTVSASIYPNADVDWREVKAPDRGMLSLHITDVPDNLDPTLHVRRKAASETKLRVLYLEAAPDDNDIDQPRFEGVAVTRVRPWEDNAGSALEKLDDYGMVIVSSISDARQFGLNRKENHERLQRFVERGGKCLVLRPHGCSFAENSLQMGAILESASSQYDNGAWHAAHAADGYKIAGRRGCGWCSGGRAKFPHQLVWSFGGQRRRIDRVVIYNHTTSNGARMKEFAVSVSDDGQTFRSAGKFAAAQSDARQEFTFAAADCKYVQLTITSNYGHEAETQLGEVEFYGPSSLTGFFGVPLEGGERDERVVCADPMHWVTRRPYSGKIAGWSGDEHLGWWTGWEKQGFELVYADRAHPQRYAVTLFKTMGKGWVILDSMQLARTKFAGNSQWKLQNYFNAASTFLGDYDNTQRANYGGDETVELPITKPADYLVRIGDRHKTSDYSHRSARSYRFSPDFRFEESEYEPNDRVKHAEPLASDEMLEESFFPGGDVDWFKLTVEQPSVVEVMVDEVPSNLDPLIEVHRADLVGKPTKVLYLACRPDTDLDRRDWGPAPVTFTRIEAGTLAEATAMTKLSGYDLVILDGLDDRRRFGMNRKETYEAIQRYAEGGGKFLLVAPQGCSTSLIAKDSGGTAVDWSSSSDLSWWHPCNLADGLWAPGNDRHAWGSRSRAEFPHWITFRLGGDKPATVSRMVVYNTSYRKEQCAKEVEILVGDRPQGLRSVGKFECKQTNERQEFEISPVAARYIKLLIHSNYGDKYQTQLGEIEFYGPDTPRGFFGVHFYSDWRNRQGVTYPKPDHWIVSKRVRAQRSSWQGAQHLGYFTDWEQSGFEMVVAERPEKEEEKPSRAVTLCKPVGKGFIVLDTQPLGDPRSHQQMLWKLQNYFDIQPTLLNTFNGTQQLSRGGGEHFQFAAEPGVYYLRLRDSNAEAWSLEKYTLLAQTEPVENPFEPNDTPERAAWLASAQPVRTTIFPRNDVDWFRIAVANKEPVYFEIIDVPQNLDPRVEFYASGQFKEAVRTFNYTQGGSYGCPEMFYFEPPAPGEYFVKVHGGGGYYSSGLSANSRPCTVRAVFAEAKKPKELRILAVSPVSGMRDASLRPRIEVTFDQALSPRTLSEGSLAVTGAKSGRVAGKLTYDAASYRAVFTPSRSLALDETVTVVAKTGLQAVSGGKPAKDFTWQFSTMRPIADDGKEATVRIALSPEPPVGAGEVIITIKPSRRLQAPPTVKARTEDGREIAVTALEAHGRKQWQGKLKVPAGTRSGSATFVLQGMDDRGAQVSKIIEGAVFSIDTAPPPAMEDIAAVPAAAGRARVTWKRLVGVPDLNGYRLYRATKETNRIADATLVKSVTGANFLMWDDPTPEDGTWFYFVRAVDRAGNEGQPSPAVRVVTDRVAPKQAIEGVTAQVTEKPRIDIAWKKTADGQAVGYSVFRFEQGKERSDLTEVTPLTEAPLDRTSLQDFPKDATYVYIVAARDQAGNLGPASAPAEVVLDTHKARVAFKLSADYPLTQGDHKVTLTLNEPLAATPELSLRMPDRSKRKLGVTKKDDLTYEAPMRFTLEDPEGWVYFEINGVDLYGNKGLYIHRGYRFLVDTGPPKSWVYTKPGGPRLGAGKIELTVDFGEDVKDGPTLWYTVGEKRFDVPIKRQKGRRFTGELTLTKDTPNGKAQFHTSATDSFDHAGGVVVHGRDFVIDTVPSEPPVNVAVRPAPENSLEVSWASPTREPIAHFRLYGAPAEDVKPGKDALLVDGIRSDRARYKPKDDQIYWFVVTAIDRAGNESAPSRTVKGVPDLEPPPPAKNVEVALEHDGRLRVKWVGPQTDEPIRYYVYRFEEPKADVAGQKPVHEADETFVIDDPQKDGVFHFVVTAVDEAGNESTPAAAEPIDYDVIPPTAVVEITPPDGQRTYRESYYVHYPIGVLSAGEKTVTLTASEKLSEQPTLRYRTRSMDTPREIALTEADGKWQGKITVPERTDDGLMYFFFEGLDRKQNRGDVVTKGKGNLFWIDTVRPEAVASLKVASLPVGKVALEWSPPPGDRSREVQYAIYRSKEKFQTIEGLEPVQADLQKTKYTDEPKEDGTYYYSVVATDQANNVGKVLESLPAVSDGTPPKQPGEMKATVKGEVYLSWQPDEDKTVRYRLLRGDEIIADNLETTAFADAPVSDGTFEYLVVAIDAAGNESIGSETLKVDYTSTLPMASIVTEPGSPIRSTFRVVLTCTQELANAPELFLHLAYGSPLRVLTKKRDEAGREWVGSVQVNKDTPNGTARFTFRGVSKEGASGTRVKEGETVVIDTRPPTASAHLDPPSPIAHGSVKVTLRVSEPLKETPTLSLTTMGTPGRSVELKAEKDGYVGQFEVTEQDRDGIAYFEFAGIDIAGNVGSHLGDSKFIIDSHPPKPPLDLKAEPKEHGYVELTWRPPLYQADEIKDDIAGYRVYASEAEFTSVADLEPLERRVARIPSKVRPLRDGKFFFALTTVDRTGLESPPSKLAECRSDRTAPKPPTITKAEAKPESIEIAWDAEDEAVAFSVFVLVPGEERWRHPADHIKEQSFTYTPLRGGDYTVRVQAFDTFGHGSQTSKSAVVAFAQKAPLASLKLPAAALGYGEFKVQVETTRPLVRAPKLQFVPESSDPIDLTMQGNGREWSGALRLDENVKGTRAKFTYEGVATVDGKEVVGRGVLTGDSVGLDFEPPTARIEFLERMPKRDRKIILMAGRHRFNLHVSEPLAADPKLVFTPRGKETQTAALTKRSDTLWTGILVVDNDVGDGSGIFELAAQDRHGNPGDAITENRNVEIDTIPPNKVGRIRAVPLPGGRVRVDWTAPYLDDGNLDKEANTFYLYRSESEVKNITGLQPHRVVERTLGTFDVPSADREYFYAIAAVDRAKNIGEVSASAPVHVDKTAPKPPRDPRVKQLETGVVHLSWQPPEGEEPIYYNVYLADHPILTAKGLTPRNPGVTWTEIYGSPNEDGKYYFAVTSVDNALNESEPSESVLLDYKAIPPIAKFKIEPDIWLTDGEYGVTLATTKDLVETPKVEISSESGKRYPIAFEGAGSQWQGTIRVDETYPEGTYGFVFRGKDAEGNIGDEILRGPLFHVDKTATLPPGELKIEPDSKGTPGAVVLHWATPKREGQQTEVPHFYNIYRATQTIQSIESMQPVHTYKVKYENIDDYHYTDMPPDNGTYFYVVTSLDMARNESAPSNVFEVTVKSDSPRATLELFTLRDVGASPAPTDPDGNPILGKGKARLVVKTTSALGQAPKIVWHLKRKDDELAPVAMTGRGTTWQGELDLDADYDDTMTAFFKFEGVSEDGTKGTFIRKGDKFRIDSIGPVAEIVIPSAYKMKVNVKTNKLEVPSVHGGLVAIKLTADEELAQAPELTYALGEGNSVPVPLTGFGRNWRGHIDVPLSAGQQDGKFEFKGLDRAGNVSTKLAKRRYPYDTDDGFPPRKIANYATTGGYFTTDTFAPDPPLNVETEMRKLGVAVIKWDAPSEEAMTYNLYRSLTPILSTDGMKPIKTEIYAEIMVDDPPVDGNYFYAVTAEDLAGNESQLSENKSVFIDTIKPELKIKAVPSGDDFVILMDENAPLELSLTINFPGQKSRRVELGGSSGELQKYEVRNMGGGRRGIVLPQMAAFFNGRVEVIVHSPDPEGNMVEAVTEVEMKKINASTGGEVESVDEQVQLVIPPGLEPVIPKGPKEKKRVGGYENLFFIQYANIPTEKPTVVEGEKRKRDEVDPLPPGLEVVGRPYVIQMNIPPEEPLELQASASQVDFSQLTQLTAKLKMKIPTMYSDAVEDPEYLKTRLKVVKWLPARSDDEPGRWEYVPDIEVDVKNKQIITPAKEITTYVIVSERTPPSIRALVPDRGDAVTDPRPEISCLIVDKGTGVAVGAENRIVMFMDGRKIEEKFLTISKGDPTEVSVSYQPPEDLTPGAHIVGIRAEDVVENVAHVKWQFIVDNKPPTILSVAPTDRRRLPVARPVFHVRVTDEGGLDPSRTELAIDGDSVSSSHLGFDEATGILSYSCRDDLESGKHQVKLVLFDKGGLSTEKEWTFATDLAPPVVAGMQPVPDSFVAPETAKVVLRVQDELGRVRVHDLRVDGTKVVRSKREGDGGHTFDPETGEVAYTASTPFTLGEHAVEALFADDLGNAATKTWRFTVKQGAPPATPLDAEATPKAYTELAAKVDTQRIEKSIPDALPAVKKLVEDAKLLEAEHRLEESAWKYAEATEKLKALDDRAQEIEQVAAKAMASPKGRFRAAKKDYLVATRKVDRERLRRYVPEDASEAEKLLDEAATLAAQEKFDESAAKYAKVAEQLKELDEKAQQAQEEAKAKGSEQLEAAKKRYAELAAKVDRERLAAYVPDAISQVGALVTEAKALAEDENFGDSMQKYVDAAKKLTDADAQAQELARKAELAELEAAKKKYTARLADANLERINKYQPEGRREFEQLAAEAEKLREANQLTEATAKYSEATDKLVATDAKARGLEHEAAKKQYAELAAKIDRKRLEKHVPGAMPDIEALIGQAEALAAGEKLEDSTGKYQEALQRLTELDAKATKLGLEAHQAQFQAAKAQYEAAAGRADLGRVAKYQAEGKQELDGLLKQAEQIAKAGDLVQGAAKYSEAAKKILALEQKAKELQEAARAAILAKFQAAKQKYTKAAQEIDRDRIVKYLPKDAEALGKLVEKAKALEAEAKLEESTAEYTEAAATLALLDARAKEKERVEQQKIAAAHEAAKGEYIALAGRANHERIAKYVPEGKQTMDALAEAAKSLTEKGLLAESTAKYKEATIKLAAFDKKAQELEEAAIALLKTRYESTRKSYAESLAAIDRKLAEKLAPGDLSAIEKLAKDAEALAADGKLEAAAQSYTEAHEQLTALKQKTEDPVEMTLLAIEDQLKDGKYRPALKRITKELLDQWVEHRRGRYKEMLEWLRKCQKAHPRLRIIGRTRLQSIRKKLKQYVEDEEGWIALHEGLEKTKDPTTKAEKVKVYIRRNAGSIFLPDAEKLLEKLLDELD